MSSRPLNKQMSYDCRSAYFYISQKVIMKSLPWDHVIEAQRFTADPMLVVLSSTGG